MLFDDHQPTLILELSLQLSYFALERLPGLTCCQIVAIFSVVASSPIAYPVSSFECYPET